MLATLALIASVSGVGACSHATPVAAPPDLRALYERGRTYVAFRDAATRRRRAWREHYANAAVADALVTRMEAVGGRWMLLVVAEDWCGDSANTIPYVARLVDVAPNLEMRIINSEVGKGVMEAHRTPDGRAATPTIVLLDSEFNAAGCFVERPKTLQRWFLENEDKLEEAELFRQKYDWYAKDAGAATLEEVVSIIEAAEAGDPTCRD